MLRTLQAPPPKGSLQEWALIFLLDKLEDIEHARFRSLAQLILDKEEGAKAFEEYMRIAFPSLAKRKKSHNEDTKKVLQDWIATGPMKVTPMPEFTLKSKMAARVTRSNDERAERIYTKLK